MRKVKGAGDIHRTGTGRPLEDHVSLQAGGKLHFHVNDLESNRNHNYPKERFLDVWLRHVRTWWDIDPETFRDM